MDMKKLTPEGAQIDGGEVLRRILDRLIQGLVMSWIALGALGSLVFLYIALRFSFAIVIAFERVVKSL